MIVELGRRWTLGRADVSRALKCRLSSPQGMSFWRTILLEFSTFFCTVWCETRLPFHITSPYTRMHFTICPIERTCGPTGVVQLASVRLVAQVTSLLSVLVVWPLRNQACICYISVSGRPALRPILHAFREGRLSPVVMPTGCEWLI